MAFTAQDVKSLREKTGVGMMECKKALTEANGDMDKAIDYLREKGLAAAAKKSTRIAAEGVVLSHYDADANVGVVVEVNSETDFVAKNDKFQAFVMGVAKTVIASRPADVETLMTEKYDGTDKTVTEILNELILSIGENMKVRRFQVVEGAAATYIHGGGSVGVMVNFDVDADTAKTDAFQTMGKDVAMQVAAMNPAYLDEASVPADVVAHEKEILTVQLQEDEKNKNKPAQVIEKIVSGRIAKFFKENCLLEQVFVKDNDLSVQQYIDKTAKELGVSIKATGFVRFAKGEGLQKKEDDFAAEIASLTK